MSTSNAEWTYERPTEIGPYLFIGDMECFGSLYEYSAPKYLRVRGVDAVSLYISDAILTPSLTCFHNITLDKEDALACWYGSWLKLQAPCDGDTSWTNTAPTKAGVYFFKGCVLKGAFGGRNVVEFFDCNGTLEAYIPPHPHRAKVGDFNGLWCEVVVPPLPEKPVLDYDSVPF